MEIAATPLTEHNESDDQALHRRVERKPPDGFRVVRVGLKDNIMDHGSEHQQPGLSFPIEKVSASVSAADPLIHKLTTRHPNPALSMMALHFPLSSFIPYVPIRSSSESSSEETSPSRDTFASPERGGFCVREGREGLSSKGSVS